VGISTVGAVTTLGPLPGELVELVVFGEVETRVAASAIVDWAMQLRKLEVADYRVIGRGRWGLWGDL